jgi:hypothetical protein
MDPLLDPLDQVALPCQAVQLPDAQTDEHREARQRRDHDRC